MSERTEGASAGLFAEGVVKAGAHDAPAPRGRFARLAAVAVTALRWLLTLTTSLLGLLAMTFLIGRALPVDPVLAVVGEHASPAVYAQARAAMGIDRPLPVQFGLYLWRVLHADFGVSVTTGQPVLHDVAQFFPATVELASLAMLIGIAVGVPAGVLAAVWRGRAADTLIRLVALCGYSTPVFWLGLIGLGILYEHLGWIAGPGRIDIAYQYSIDTHTGLMLVDTLLAGSWDAFVNACSHLVLPGILLGLSTAAYLSRMTRSFMIDALSSEYVLAARMKGLGEFRVVFRHALANACIPLLTTLALAYAYLLEGTVLVETVFTWPGIGLYIAQSIFSADLPAVLGATTLVGLCFILLNAAVDAVTPLLDPRVRPR
ncbi:ABC transporter permease [Paraburkholderia tropica]|uniref:ABC transporter permease n=1 Tax=Paraburkholderia tropica TaxID=92647 RepID=UPI002AB0C165|nr:ABC transporter permease [Paraburkholderia tropica]